MKKASIAVTAALLMSASAYAQTITCDETPNATTQKYGHFARFVITFNDHKQITEISALNWNLATDRMAGRDTTGSRLASEHALNPRVMGTELVYTYSFQDQGDGDYPGPETRVTYRLPVSLQGRAEVTEDAGNAGKDEYLVNCR